MQQVYEYTVIPAPARGEKVRGARTGIERFSYTLLTEMNRMAAHGWEYVRAETLPCEERSGLTSRTTVYHNVLVFRRAIAPAQPVHAESEREAPAPRPVNAVSDTFAAARPAPVVTPPVAAPASPPRLAGTGVHLAKTEPEWQDDSLLDDDGTDAPRADIAGTYDEPGFAQEDDRTTAPAVPPAFVQRPPLAAKREDELRDPMVTREQRGVFSGAMPAGTRLGPAER